MSLFKNPFYILGATSRDSIKQIMELAQEKSLTLDQSVVAEARNILTHPRKRMSAEIGWFPGCKDFDIEHYINHYKNNELDYIQIYQTNELQLIKFNDIMFLFENYLDKIGNSFHIYLFMLAQVGDFFEEDELIEIINEDRKYAGIPEISDIAILKAELYTHLENSLVKVETILRKFSQKEITETMLFLVEQAVYYNQNLSIVDTLIDKFYTTEVQDILQNKAQSIEKMANKIKDTISSETYSKEYLSAQVDLFLTELSDFDEIMQPIQVSMQQRGLEHKPSKEMAFIGRDVAISLYNEVGELELSEKVARKLKDLFVEIGSFAERVTEDIEKLYDIKIEKEKKEKELTCKVKQNGKTIVVSPNGIIISGGISYAIEEIETIRFGQTVDNNNKVIDSVIAFGCVKKGEVALKGLTDNNYQMISDKLWKTVGVSITIKMVNTLTNGGNIYGWIYNDKVNINGVFYLWKEIDFFSKSGYLYIVPKADTMVGMLEKEFIYTSPFTNYDCIKLSYRDDQNAHVIGAILSRVKPKIRFEEGKISFSSSTTVCSAFKDIEDNHIYQKKEMFSTYHRYKKQKIIHFQIVNTRLLFINMWEKIKALLFVIGIYALILIIGAIIISLIAYFS